ncbi:MAG TPA: membrane protein insertase YidC, partial [Alphaproteobacteria bacterium]|nr:membrane protein insertase YidC [Alphaproteobacteria bacterium]
GATAPGAAAVVPGSVPGAAATARTREQVVAEGSRVKINTPRLHGSINATGGRIDDLTLADYHTTVDPQSPEVTLLSPAGTQSPYFAEFGWVPAASTAADQVPNASTPWQVSGGPLAPNAPVTLTWTSPGGVQYTRTVAVDANYMFTVTDKVTNGSGAPVTLSPYGLVSRHGEVTTEGFYILHEGPLGVLDGTLREYAYDDLADAPTEHSTVGGWLGITDKYWLTALVPEQQAAVKAGFRRTGAGAAVRTQVDFLGDPRTLEPNGTTEITSRLFAGAKEFDVITGYEGSLGITNFDRAIDFGWFYFLTRPIFWLLLKIHGLVGNFGVAILVLTVIIRLALYPLANKSFTSMSKMKALQPKMQELREKYGEDRVKMNTALMELYKKEKVNPVSGCLPILVQIPIFFALYKVLFVTIEMRHAPFFGWIQDLSAPDPTTIFNLFGLIPWNPPQFLMIGIWPLIMGVTMYIQQKLNPPPADPVQARIFQMLPILFTFMLGGFPAGLVIYWAWNNTLSVAQQYMIMRRMGVKA